MKLQTMLVLFSLFLTVAVVQAAKWQEGTAKVGQGGNSDAKCPNDYVGYAITVREDGCEHDDCTTAKDNARDELIASLKNDDNGEGKGCIKYVTAGARCKKAPGCK